MNDKLATTGSDRDALPVEAGFAAVIGGGPAGLMAAEALAEAGHPVVVFEAKPSLARKFLMAGKSGLNLTKDEPVERLLTHYGAGEAWLSAMIRAFDAQAVQDWATGLGQSLFTGSTGRVFPTVMKGSPLLRAWLARLDEQGAQRRTGWRWTGWQGEDLVFETATGRQLVRPAVTVLALGGASWARLGSDGAWAETLEQDGVDLAPFQPSNAALSLTWSAHMQPHFGAALKSVEWRAGAMTSRGEAILSAAGLEGGGLYPLTPMLRAGHALRVDLMPDVTAETLRKRLPKDPKKARLSHWLKNTLRLPPVKVALFHEAVAGAPPQSSPQSPQDWIKMLKDLPLPAAELRPMDEAISTAGGVRRSALTEDLMLRARPGTFCAGEMLDWESPTGGYLLTGCFATGRWAGQAAARYLVSYLVSAKTR